jgi:hypothetical protein
MSEIVWSLSLASMSCFFMYGCSVANLGIIFIRFHVETEDNVVYEQVVGAAGGTRA